MPGDIREYLVERFRSDAVALRERAEALSTAKGPVVGPDAALSRAMATACEEVASLAEQLPSYASLPDILVALNALLPKLNLRANDPLLARTPAVRSVYAGAATRVQEVIAAEARAADAASLGYMDNGVNAGEDPDDDDEDFDDGLEQ